MQATGIVNDHMPECFVYQEMRNQHVRNRILP
ncbi:MAG: DNA-3-methyladenine glycosylase I [Oscillospiraceae bacterium]|nr:DNA-3-methyladenine glycosylase I [Oscillospiraceae bacterium]